MYLKTVELTGFKSFPTKTAINFERGITAIVGPNGSGKSNISDAVRWVFGEMSSKVLRGAKMEDVIFGGTKEIKPSSFARVSLVIDNSDKLVDCDYSEIKITRQLSRSGDSGYFINDKNVRLKDIYELFLNTGVGKEGYSIIGQGRIAELISKRSDDRRSIFEEASGISKYRYQKYESEKKLSDTKENQIRIRDIVHEIEGRIDPLRTESEKAKKYLDLYDRKKAIEIYVWVNTIEKIKEELDKIIKDYEISKFNHEKADAQINRLNDKTENLYNKIQEINLAYENTKNEKFRLQNVISNQNLEIDMAQKEVGRIRDDIEFSLSEFEQNKTEIFKLDNEITSKTEMIDKINSEYKSLEMEIEDIVSYSEHVDLKLSEQNQKTEEINNLIADLNVEISELKIKISEKNSEIKHIRERKEILEADIEKVSELKEQNEKDLSDLNSLKKSTERAKLKTITESEETEEKITELQKSERIKKKEYEALYLEREKNENYIQSLTYIYENLEGYPESVKSVVKKSGLKGVNGTVAQLINVDEKYAQAIEIALGQNLQNIIVDDENTAQDAIKYLKTNNIGRATFYPVSTIKGRFIERDKLDYLRLNNNASGFIDAGSNLVKCGQKYENIIKYLLGRTIICDNISNATRIANKTGYVYKIVTLDGQVINAGGSFTGGSIIKKGSLLSNKNEIEKLKKRNIECDKKQTEIQKDIDAAASDIAKLSEYNITLKEQLNAQISDLYKTDSEIKMTLSSLYLIENQINSGKRELKENEERLVLQTQSEFEIKLAEAVKKSEEYTQTLSIYKTSINTTIREKEIVLGKITQKQLALAGISSNINIENERLENLNRTRINYKSQNDKITTQNSEKSQILSSDENKITAMKNEITEFEKSLREAEFSMTGYENKKTEFEKENVESRNIIKEKTRERDILFKETTRLEMRKTEKEKEHDDLINKLWDDYSLAFTDAKAICDNSDDIKASEIKTADIQKELTQIKDEIKELGNVNVNAIEEYKELSERYGFMKKQSGDLSDAMESLQKIIENLETEMKALFADSMRRINENFKAVFSELFGGGTAEIIYLDPENVLESELEIEVQPPGKNVKHISLLSGGEQAFVAIALYFALLKINPAPFCILDEIESALDEVNVDRFAAYLKRYAVQTQFIVISHRRGTMEAAGRLYGITMQDRGISTYLALDINEAEKRIKNIGAAT